MSNPGGLMDPGEGRALSGIYPPYYDTARPGGWWASWWIVFGDPARDDPFHDTTQRWLLGVENKPKPAG